MAIKVVTPTTFGGIHGAVLSACDGDVILVKKGVYHESVFIFRDNIKIIAQDEDVILDGNNVFPVAFAWYYVNNIEISGFTIRNYVYTAISSGFSFGNRIIGNKICNAKCGISAFFVYESLIWNNCISNICLLGIDILGSVIDTVNNDVQNCGCDGINYYSFDPIWIIGNHCNNNHGNGIKGIGSANTLANNQCHDNRKAGIYSEGDYNKFTENHCCKNGGSGLEIDGDQNLLYDNKVQCNGWNIPDTGIVVSGDNNCLIENNMDCNLLDGILVTVNCCNTFISDNIINCNPGNGIKLLGHDSTIEDNEINKNQNIGLEITSNNNLVFDNEIMHNLQFDIKSTGNSIFVDNDCKKSSPPSICMTCDD